MTYFKNKNLGYLVGKAARAFQLSDFYNTFNEIKTINASCAEYLIEIGFEHWARAHFAGNRYNVMTSNVAETWNSVLREAREYPIVALVEYIREKLMNWFAERRNHRTNSRGRLTHRVNQILDSNFEDSAGMRVRRINHVEFEVNDKTGATFHVNLAEKACSCFSFQKLLIPCPHAIAAAIKEKVCIKDLVSSYYSVETLAAAYAVDIVPISTQVQTTEDITEGEGEPSKIYPPRRRCPPGRPRKSRIMSTGEIRVNICGIIRLLYNSKHST